MSKLEKIAKEFQKLDGKKIKVGVLSSSGNYPGGQSVVEVACYNELGTAKAPPRPFMRQTFQNHQHDIKRVQAELVRRVISGQATADSVISGLGKWYSGMVKKSMQNSWWTPNAASTIMRKGSSKPLLDTRRLINSIDWEKV